jgi:uncharacterized membrane protein
LGRKRVILQVFVFLLIIFTSAPSIVSAQTQISDSLILTIYLDGFTQVDQIIELNQSVLSFNLKILAKTSQNLLVVDENGLPLENSIIGNNAVIYSVGSTKIDISYLTQDLTSKIGKYWTVRFDYPESKVLVFPKNASIISINSVPDLIESTDDSLRLTMPSGLTEVTYTAEHFSDEQNKNTVEGNSFDQWSLAVAVLALSLTVPLTLAGFWLWKRKKNKPKPKTDKPLNEVDLEKLFRSHRELSQDETKVLNFLASKHGKAFEAEVFELLNLPRTTTWRLIRRLAGLEIVYVRKSRRQNIVLIRDKYLNKPLKCP